MTPRRPPRAGAAWIVAAVFLWSNPDAAATETFPDIGNPRDSGFPDNSIRAQAGCRTTSDHFAEYMLWSGSDPFPDWGKPLISGTGTGVVVRGPTIFRKSSDGVEASRASYGGGDALPENTVDCAASSTSEVDSADAYLKCYLPNPADERQPLLVPCAMGAVALHRVNDPSPKPFCTGIVISPRHVLTAAHCAFARRASGPPISHIGVSEILVEPGKQVFGAAVEYVGRYRDDPAVDPATKWQYETPSDPRFFETPDLAIYRLDDNAPAFHEARIARIHTGDLSAAPFMMAFGYGTNPHPEWGGKKQATLLAGASETFGIRKSPNHPGCNPAFEVLIGAQRGRRAPAPIEDTCPGDSGGPVYSVHAGVWYLSALTSRSAAGAGEDDECTRSGGIYVRLGAPEILSWLDTVLRTENCQRMNGAGDDQWVAFDTCG